MCGYTWLFIVIHCYTLLCVVIRCYVLLCVVMYSDSKSKYPKIYKSESLKIYINVIHSNTWLYLVILGYTLKLVVKSKNH